jgi:inosose dehydratase
MRTIRIANAPCSWGVLEFEGTVAAREAEDVLTEMAAAGYAGTELGDWGFMPTEPEALGRLLAGSGLAMVGAFVPVALSRAEAHGPGEELALRTARLIAAVSPDSFIVLSDDNGTVPARVGAAGRIQPGQGLDDHGWHTLALGANRIARAVRQETGLRTVFHHHCAGYVETPEEIEALLSRTDPTLLGLCLDTGHYRFGGGDPAALLARHGSRVWHVHFKDCAPAIAARSRALGWDYFRSVGAGVFCELGRGEVDFAAVLRALDGLGYEGWIVVEQDVLPGMGSPLESARRNRRYLESLGLC